MMEEVYVIAGQEYSRIKWGDAEQDAEHVPEIPANCPDCDQLWGQYHTPGCDIERCPACGGQVIACDCEYEEEDEALDEGVSDAG